MPRALRYTEIFASRHKGEAHSDSLSRCYTAKWVEIYPPSWAFLWSEHSDYPLDYSNESRHVHTQNISHLSCPIQDLAVIFVAVTHAQQSGSIRKPLSWRSISHCYLGRKLNLKMKLLIYYKYVLNLLRRGWQITLKHAPLRSRWHGKRLMIHDTIVDLWIVQSKQNPGVFALHVS